MPSLVYTAPTSASASPTTSHVSQKSAAQTPVGAIVGGVIGGLLALVFIPLIVLWLRRRKAKENLASPFDLSKEAKPEGASLVHVSAFLKKSYSLNSGS
jgi:gas vesicle protein